MKPTNYTCPPAAKIAAWMTCTLETAATARALMRGEIPTLDNPAFPKTCEWVNSCYNQPRRICRIMAALVELFECYSSEAIWGDSGEFGWPVAEYLNTGDTYSPTILFRRDLGRFQLTTWGDFYERNEKRLHLTGNQCAC